MRVTRLGIFAIIGLLAAPAYAAGPAYTSSYESGVHVFRGNHGAAYSAQALETERMHDQQKIAKRQADETARLAALVKAQTQQIADLQHSLKHHEDNSHSRKQRRRTYYGNSAFFGRNGFYGNRYYSGAAPLQPRHRYRYRPYK